MVWEGYVLARNWCFLVFNYTLSIIITPKRRKYVWNGFWRDTSCCYFGYYFLGPDKLPDALINVAKFFKNVKKHLTEAKDTIDRELNIVEMKQEALQLKQNMTKITNDTKTDFMSSSREVKDLFADLNKQIEDKDDKEVKELGKEL